MIRAAVAAQINTLGENEVEVIISTSTLARDGHILEPSGCDLTNYQANPIVLWRHNPDVPVGRASDLKVNGDKILARITFAPTGISPKADEVRGLVKNGIVSGVSVGFDVIDGEPLDPKRPRGGQRFTKWELLECSFCSVPADPGAAVTARAQPQEKNTRHLLKLIYVERKMWYYEHRSGAYLRYVSIRAQEDHVSQPSEISFRRCLIFWLLLRIISCVLKPCARPMTLSAMRFPSFRYSTTMTLAVSSIPAATARR